MPPSEKPPEMGEKTCNKCEVVKPKSHFSPSKKGYFGLQGRCRVCSRKATDAWRDANPERYKESTRQTRRLKFYGLTAAAYEDMLSAQAGRCAICRQEPRPGKVLAVDHSHETGAVRALLCRNCNAGIGMLQDSPTVLLAASQYLSLHLRT